MRFLANVSAYSEDFASVAEWRYARKHANSHGIARTISISTAANYSHFLISESMQLLTF